MLQPTRQLLERIIFYFLLRALIHDYLIYRSRQHKSSKRTFHFDGALQGQLFRLKHLYGCQIQFVFLPFVISFEAQDVEEEEERGLHIHFTPLRKTYYQIIFRLLCLKWKIFLYKNRINVIFGLQLALSLIFFLAFLLSNFFMTSSPRRKMKNKLLFLLFLSNQQLFFLFFFFFPKNSSPDVIILKAKFKEKHRKMYLFFFFCTWVSYPEAALGSRTLLQR